MSYRMIDALVTMHTQEVRRQVARCRSGRHHAGPAPAGTVRPTANAVHPAGLRNRIGFALIEAGLHLSASGREPKPISE